MQKTAAALPLFGGSALATLAYAVISAEVAKNQTWKEDLEAREKIVENTDAGTKKAAEKTHHIGKWYTLVPLAVASGAALALRGKIVAGVTVAGASLAAPALSALLDRVMKWRKPPPGKPNQENTSYPSGHALETTAVALATGWVLARERVASPFIVAPLAAAVSMWSGATRLAADRHWVTDAAGGYSAGIALGCLCAGAYELASATWPKR